jgi:DNA-binding MarR family transcriptional regulator
MARRVEERVGYVLKQVQQALRAAMDEALRRRGLTTAQYATLSILEAEAGLSGAELARRCFVTPQTMNEIVARLEADGLVERRRGDDARVLRAYLTAAGQDLVGACHQTVGVIEERMVSGLSPSEQRQLLDGLRRCVDALEHRLERPMPSPASEMV